ncbi:hypothetical protein PR003_g26238 [Phytophthora rubi]|uniref:Uncharacterized protein n=2 Tax=Phytophthora rubi TaxID=129364 RepID=A0A6A4CC36_9STRA|nr:hypothetical protein PR003_g26238 [Phytophthora rubi]
MPSIAPSRPRQLLPNLWVVLPQHSATPQPRLQSHSQFIRIVPKLMSDNLAAAKQPSASTSGDGEPSSALQGTPAALATPTQATTTSTSVQGGGSGPETASTGMGSSTSVPTTSNAPAASSSGSSIVPPGLGSVSTMSSVEGASLSLPAATSTPLAMSGTSASLTPMPVALLQLAAAAGASAAASLTTSTTQTASTVQYTPAVGALTRPMPRVGAGVLPAPSVAQVPASIYDIRRGETLVGMPDGLAHSVPVPHFSEEELTRLHALGSANTELLQANPLRPVNFSDAHVRLAAEREMLALVRCYGVESFAARVTNHSLAAVGHSADPSFGGPANHPGGFPGTDLYAPDGVCRSSERVN